MTVLIGPAGATDVPALLEIIQAAFDTRYGEAWSGPQLIGSLGMPDTWVRIARDAATAPIGFVLVRRMLTDAELLLVAVMPQQRSHGLGRRLVEDAAALAARHGAAQLFLEVRDGNNAALALYASAAFVQVGRRTSYYAGAGGERFDAITMRRGLSSQV